MRTRNDGPTGRSETFEYDTLDRLTRQALAGGATVAVNYDANGNIKDKSDVATSYTYGESAGPHALTGISGGPKGTQSYTYDNNGNMTGGGGRSIEWTSFNQAKVIADGGGHSCTFTFGAAHERVKQVAVNGSITTTTTYVGGLFELVTSSGGTEEKNYIMTPAGRVAVYTAGTYALPNVRYFHTDGLGSITAVSDESGNVVKRFAYDAWGKRTDPATGAVTTSATNGRFTRGFTDHEALDDLGLVHMNGRVYDPVLGRFLSADPFVQDSGDSQAYNRYSYLSNNPLGGSDPSGFFSLKDAVKIVAIVVLSYVTAGLAAYAASFVSGAGAFGTVGGAFSAMTSGGLVLGEAIAAGAAAGFASGFAGSLLNGGSIGEAFKAGLIGGVIGGIAGGLAYSIGGSGLGYRGRALAHGVVSGGAEAAQGGQFRHGFYAGFATGMASPRVNGMSNRYGRVVAAAVVGGTASALGRGKFANGAVSGAFQQMLNDAQHEAAEKKYFETSGSVAAVVLAEESVNGGLKGGVGRFWRREINRMDYELKNSFVVYDTFSDLDDLAARLDFWSNKTDRILITTHGTNDLEGNPILGIKNNVPRAVESAAAQDYWRNKLPQSHVTDLAKAYNINQEALIYHHCEIGKPTVPQMGVNLLRESIGLSVRQWGQK